MSDRTQIGAHVLAVALLVAAAAYGAATGLSPATPAVSSPTPATTSSPSPSSAAATTPQPTPSSPASTVTPAPSPSASRRPLATTAYTYGGRAYTGVSLGAGWTITAPFDGRVEVHVYQLINGSLREGTDTAGIPSYPYVVLTAADGRELKYRPGALTTDTQLRVRGSQAKAGDDLFTVVGSGISSWHDFYDPTITFQIVVSLVTITGADADAAPLVKAR